MAEADRLRLFFALWPDDEVRRRISADADAAITAAGGRPVPAVNYHVTLAFLGSIRASSLPEIVHVIGDVRFGPFSFALDRTGYWPRSRIAWLAPAKCPHALSALVDDIWIKLESLGFVREDLRPYMPHVSLCRGVTRGLDMQLDTPIRWTATSFGLVSSAPGEGAPVYKILEEFPAGD